MLRKYASLIIAAVIVMLVVGACIVRSHNHGRRGQPVYVQKHKHKKPKKIRDHRR
jgi:hypothetical protein